LYGSGSGTTTASAWRSLIAISLLFGAFVGVMIQVTKRRDKRNKSLDRIDQDIRRITERELHVVFCFVGAILGILIARLLWLPPIGYLICVVLLVLLGLSRSKVEQIIP
jgi:predicted histidine transporter YuiF (NhaC family)